MEIGGTTSFKKHWEVRNKKYIISQGSARSSKTWSILQMMILISLKNKNKRLVSSVVGVTIGKLKDGAIRDFKNIMYDLGLWREEDWNISDRIYKFRGWLDDDNKLQDKDVLNTNIIEFFSADNPAKLRGPQRDFLFINECNNISLESVRQLIIRTKYQVFMDYNPLGDFWVFSEFINNTIYKDKVGYVKTALFDNEKLDPGQRQSLLDIAANDDYFRKVYVDGELGFREGVIFEHFNIVDTIPEHIKKESKIYLGLDFGFNDPTTIIKVYVKGNPSNPLQEIWIEELFYESDKILDNYIDILKDNMYLIVADSARKDTIQDIELKRGNIVPSPKGAGSVNWGIGLMKSIKINIVQTSTNVITEFRNYTWHQNKDGKFLNEPIDDFNHSIDAIRYVCMYVQKFVQNDMRTYTKKSKIIRI